KRIESLGGEVKAGPSAELAEWIETNTASYAAIIKEAGIRVEWALGVLRAAGRCQGVRLRAVLDRIGAGRLRRHQFAERRDRSRYGPRLRPARAGLGHPGRRYGLSDHQLSQGARTRSSAGVATARHDLGIDRAVCGAVLHAGADRPLHRGRAGRRSAHGPRSLAAARALRRGSRRVFGAAVRPRPWPAV